MTLGERWQGISARERYLVLGAVVMAIAVVLRYSPLADMEGLSFGESDDRWVIVQKIESYRKILARGDSVKEQTSLLGQRYGAQQERFMDGATPTQVGAELQGVLSSAAGEAGLNVLSSQILRVDEAGGFERVGVRLTLSGSVEGLTRLLVTVEGGGHDLVVSNLEINRKLGSSRRPTPRAGTATPPVIAPLTVSMEVRTFMRTSS